MEFKQAYQLAAADDFNAKPGYDAPKKRPGQERLEATAKLLSMAVSRVR